MAIRLYNSLSRQKEPFEPVHPGRVGMYVCGPTVYSYSHIGHMVGPVIFDTVKRFFTYCGYQVTFVINITDVDDKIIKAAGEEGVSIDTLTERVTADYFHCLDRLNVTVDQFPRATKYIDKMLALIGRLVEKGHAYPAGGDVYFDVATDEDYGKLSNRRVEELQAGTRKEVSDLKRSAADFALWKGAKPGEPAWDSPWGPGRPGWHIECSAMSMDLLGETFDIHGGGLDLIFPHHEDELAQSESCTGKPMARFWMHNGLLRRGEGEGKVKAAAAQPEAAPADAADSAPEDPGKMGKSRNNAILMRDLFRQYSAEYLRFLIVSSHYRSPIDFGEDRLHDTAAGFARLTTLQERITKVLGTPFETLSAPAARADVPAPTGDAFLDRVHEGKLRFLDAMDDDLNTGAAVGALFELVTVFNRFADEQKLDAGGGGGARERFRAAATVFRELTDVLGLLRSPPGPALVGGAKADDAVTGRLLDLLVELRGLSRKNKDFKTGDLIRDRLKEVGVAIEDRADGSRWKWEQA